MSILMIFEIEKHNWIAHTNEALNASVIGLFDDIDERDESVIINNNFWIYFFLLSFPFWLNAYKSRWLTVLLFE